VLGSKVVSVETMDLDEKYPSLDGTRVSACLCLLSGDVNGKVPFEMLLSIKHN